MTGKADGDHFHLFGTYIGRYVVTISTRRRERQIPQGDFLRGVCGFRNARRTQAFLSRFDRMRQQCGAT
jgi:hypothetical protein